MVSRSSGLDDVTTEIPAVRRASFSELNLRALFTATKRLKFVEFREAPAASSLDDHDPTIAPTFRGHGTTPSPA